MSKITMPEAAKVDVFHGTRYYTASQMDAYAADKVREALEAAADLARAKYEEAMKRREGFDRDSDEAWIIDVLSQALTYSHMEHGIRQMIPQR